MLHVHISVASKVSGSTSHDVSTVSNSVFTQWIWHELKAFPFSSAYISNCIHGILPAKLAFLPKDMIINLL